MSNDLQMLTIEDSKAKVSDGTLYVYFGAKYN